MKSLGEISPTNVRGMLAILLLCRPRVDSYDSPSVGQPTLIVISNETAKQRSPPTLARIGRLVVLVINCRVDVTLAAQKFDHFFDGFHRHGFAEFSTDVGEVHSVLLHA